jgi:hypothetical protein
MTTDRETTEACVESKEPTSVEMKSVAVHEEVPTEEAAGKTSGALKKRYRNRHLAVRRRSQPKKWTQGNGGSRKKMAAACRGMTRRIISARRKGHCFQGQGKDKAVPRTQKGRTFGKRRREKPEGTNRTRDRDLKAATSWKREDIQRDLQEGSRAGDRESKSRAFSWDSKNE